MELKCVLDFDGVLFNSAFEAYSVANKATKGVANFRHDVSFEEFLEFRAFVTDAWQYSRLYSTVRRCEEFEDLPGISPDDDDWEFSRAFFATRATMMADPEWAKMMSPYDFFFLLKPLLLEFSEKFCILSTRNVESVRRTMAFFGADVLQIFGQEDIRQHGSKIAVANNQGWLEGGKYLIVYVDDMSAHLEPFDGKVHLPLHANWGYDKAGSDSLSQHQVIAIIQSMLKLAKNGD
jgi:hypothetical protein